MYPKNAASPPAIAVGAIYLLADGTQVTSGASVRVKTGTGSWGAGGGTLSCDSTSGTWEYTPTQGETNAASFMVAVYKAACTQATITVVTTASDTPGYGGLDWGLVRQASTAVSLSATTISTSQQVASVSGNVNGSVASVVGNVGGNVVGNVNGSVASVTGNVGGITGVTFPSTVASPTNITAATGIVLAATTHTGARIPNVTLVDTTTTNTDMRGTDNALLASSYTPPLNASGTAGAVWNALLSSYTVAGSFGQRVMTVDSTSAGNGAKVTPNGHVAAVVHDAEPDSIPEDAFISGALSARVIATDAITAAKIAADAGTEIGVAVWASSTRELTSGANISLAKGTGITGFNDITAASVWSVGTRELTSGANIVLAKGTGITGLNDITANAAADAVLSRGAASVESTAEAYSITDMLLGVFESKVEAGTWTIYRTDGTTTHRTKTITTDAGAQPITRVQ